MTIQLIFSDLDGTLLDPKGDLSQENSQTIKKTIASGVDFTVASARSPEEMLFIIKELAINCPLIAYNGGLLFTYQNEKFVPIESHTVPLEEVAFIAEEITKKEPTLDISWYSKEKWYAQTRGIYLHQQQKITGLTPILCNLSDFLKSKKEIHKMMLIGEQAKIAAMEHYLNDFTHLTAAIHTSDPQYLEITSQFATKDAALKRIAAYQKIPLKNVLAIGDGKNDLAMLHCAGHSVAMGNAQPEIKKATDYVTLTNKENGVSHILKQLLFPPLQSQ